MAQTATRVAHTSVRLGPSIAGLPDKTVPGIRMPRQQLEGKINLRHVIIAEGEAGQPLGYCIGNDQYFKRDDVGCIFQLCVVEGKRRGFIGAALVKAMFDRAAYGCRLFCSWCAQDIEANHFWESLGFVPLAFRTGSRTKGKGRTPRVHIFWQKRIRDGDNETPYWFPSKTAGGALGEDRLVLPISPDVHWSEAKPTILPALEPEADDKHERPRRVAKPRKDAQKKPDIPPGALCGFSFAPPKPSVEERSAQKANRKQRPRRKHDPKYVALARELRDRFLEAVQDDPQVLLPTGKYDVTRALPDLASSRVQIVPELRALPAAA